MKRIMAILLTLTLLFSVLLPASVSAAKGAKWDLEGWREAQNKWMDGLLWTWHEGDQVPYRLNVTNYDGTINIGVQHDYLDAAGTYGVDGASNFFIGPQSNRNQAPPISPIYEAGVNYGGTLGVVFDVLAPTIVPVPNGAVLDYQIVVKNAAALTALDDFAFYWQAHMAVTGGTNATYGTPVALGSSFWNGASLHTHTSVTGNQDVPIKTPRQGASILVEKFIKVYPYDQWLPADDPNDPVIARALPPSRIKYRFVVTNNGNVPLTGITLTDDLYDITDGGFTVPIIDPLPAGGSFSWEIGERIGGINLYAEAGLHTNTARATGVYNGDIYADTDTASYFGK